MWYFICVRVNYRGYQKLERKIEREKGVTDLRRLLSVSHNI